MWTRIVLPKENTDPFGGISIDFLKLKLRLILSRLRAKVLATSLYVKNKHYYTTLLHLQQYYIRFLHSCSVTWICYTDSSDSLPYIDFIVYCYKSTVTLCYIVGMVLCTITIFISGYILALWICYFQWFTFLMIYKI